MDVIHGMVSTDVNEPTIPFSNPSLQQGDDLAILQGQPAHTGPHDKHHVFKDADGGAAGTGRGAPGKVSTLINPRRKVHCLSNGIWADTKTNPVCITLEVLSGCSLMTLAKAAEILGISVTSLKKACRRLGVDR